jgi:hypothetical protein
MFIALQFAFAIPAMAQVTFLIPDEYPIAEVSAEDAVKLLNDAVAQQPMIKGTHLFESIDGEKIVRSPRVWFAYEDMYYVKVDGG